MHWTYDTWALANGTGKAIVQTGGDTWFFIVADYAFGQALERETSAVVTANGGKVLGSVRHPLNTADFSSYLLQAQSSGRRSSASPMPAPMLTNAIKQAGEFGIVQGGQNLAGLLVFITDVHGIGLQAAQGLILTEAFYWDLNDATRAWSKRFAERNGGKYPTMIHAGVYSSVLHYLKAVEAIKTDRRREGGGRDEAACRPTTRCSARVRFARTAGPSTTCTCSRSRSRRSRRAPATTTTLRATIPAAEAFRPLDQGNCPLVKKG